MQSLFVFYSALFVTQARYPIRASCHFFALARSSPFLENDGRTALFSLAKIL